MLRDTIRPAIVLTVLLILLTGAAYPAAVTGAAQALFPWQANGSLVERNGAVVGSALIGQTFTRPEYFHSRPSAAGGGYDGAASSGTNKGPTDAKLLDTLIASRVDSAVTVFGAAKGAVPGDLVTASASGLDPHISPDNAALQLPVVARARGVDTARVSALVRAHTEPRTLWVFGEPRINVLLLNIALDSAFGGATSPTPAPSATPITPASAR
jgi:K+-transporting ATPase ATPase C chain